MMMEIDQPGQDQPFVSVENSGLRVGSPELRFLTYREDTLTTPDHSAAGNHPRLNR